MRNKVALTLKALLLVVGVFALQACFSEHYSPAPYGSGYGSSYGYAPVYDYPAYAPGPTYYERSYTPAPGSYAHELHEKAETRHEAKEAHEAHQTPKAVEHGSAHDRDHDRD